MKNYTEFYKALRKIGFKRAFVSKEDGQVVTIQYERTNESGVCINVQFWFDGISRVSNMHPSENLPNEPARMDSLPSSFKSIKGMLGAVDFENTRWALNVPKTVQKDFQ